MPCRHSSSSLWKIETKICRIETVDTTDDALLKLVTALVALMSLKKSES